MLWEFIKHKLTKVGCFVFIAFIAMFVGLLTTWALSWTGDPAAGTKGKQATESAAKVLFVGFLIAGVCALIHEHWTKWKSRQPPPLPPPLQKRIPTQTGSSTPPPLPKPADARSAAKPPEPKRQAYESNYDRDSHYQR